MNRLDLRVSAAQLVDDARRLVSAAVVDDDHLIIIRQSGKNLEGRVDQLTDSSLVIEGGKEDTYAEALRRGHHAAMSNQAASVDNQISGCKKEPNLGGSYFSCRPT